MAIFITFLQVFTMAFVFAYSIRRTKKYKSITFDVRRGMKCYGCAADVEYDLEKAFEYFEENSDDKMKLCVACKRDESLDSFIKTGFPDSTRMNKIRKNLFSKKSDRIVWYFLLAILASTAIEFVARFVFDVKIFWLLPPILNIVYWSIFWYKIKITYTEEKK